MISTDDLFRDPDEWAAFSDVLLELDGIQDRDPRELRRVFEALPGTIRNTAHAWGLSDTVFRDEAYAYLQAHRDVLKSVEENPPPHEIDHENRD